MSTFVPKEVQAGLDRARTMSMKKASRLRIVSGDTKFPVLRLWDTGFALERDGAPRLRGFVDLYDGAVHLFRCLVVASEEEADEMRYDFKRMTAVHDRAPLDFERSADVPAALIEKRPPL
ncbi:MAG: hypothetical protein AAF601_08020 [Pseudomonadota bacterium]